MARTTMREQREAEVERRRTAMDEAVAAGRLTIRQMTDEERREADARRGAPRR